MPYTADYIAKVLEANDGPATDIWRLAYNWEDFGDDEGILTTLFPHIDLDDIEVVEERDGRWRRYFYLNYKDETVYTATDERD